MITLFSPLQTFAPCSSTIEACVPALSLQHLGLGLGRAFLCLSVCLSVCLLGRSPPRLARLLMVEVDVAVVILHTPPACATVSVVGN